MSRIWIIIVVFLIVGALMIKEQTQDRRTFVSGLAHWIGDLFRNLKDITGRAVNDYQWLPSTNSTPQDVNTKINK